VLLEGGRHIEFGALLIATGAEPVRLDIPGATDSQIHYLRTFADSRAIVAKAASARNAVVVGASFIGLEVAASLRARGIAVHVVGPESVPLEACWVASSAASCATFTSRTALYFVWEPRSITSRVHG